MPRRTGRFERRNLLLLVPVAICVLTLWRFDLLWLEGLLLALFLTAVALAADRWKWSARPPAWCAPLRRWSRRPVLACTLPALLSIGLRVSLLPWLPVPHPVVPDEFSHIFLAKTFLLGRLANPPHPLWQHFETIHIISQPTFSSMYMAGQACFLVLGQWLTGNMFAGVVLSTALFCAALTWFLVAYVPPGWALYGGVLAAVRIGAASYWNNSYWGGSAGALGGALALGAYPRLVKSWKPGPAAVLACGLVVLANTRPYEGAILGLAIGVALLWELWRARGFPPGLPWKRLSWSALAMIVVLSAAGWGMTRQFKAVTGSAFTLPYQVNQKMYGWPTTLPWQKVPAVEYRHSELGLYHEYETGEHDLATTPAKIPLGLLLKYSYLWRFYFGVAFSAVFLYTSKILAARRTRVVWLAGGAVLLAVLTEQSGYPHYAAPLAPVILLFVIEGLRRLTHWQMGSTGYGSALVRSAVPLLCVVLVVHAATYAHQGEAMASPNFYSWCCTDVRQRDREPLVQRIRAVAGEHLVIVRYDLEKYDTSEWVYNEPDIEHARVIFARDMGALRNRELTEAFPLRHVWHAVVSKNGTARLEQTLAGTDK